MNYAVIDTNYVDDINYFSSESEALLFHVNRRNCYKVEYQTNVRLVRLQELNVNHLNNLAATDV